MNILIVGAIPSHFGTRNFGGVSIHTWQHAKLISEYGFDVTVLATGSYLGKSFDNSGVRVIGVPSFSLRGVSKSMYLAAKACVVTRDFRTSSILNRLLTSYKLGNLDLRIFDVIHVQSIHSQFHSIVHSDEVSRKILTVHSYDDILKAEGNKKRKLLEIHSLGQKWFDDIVHVSETDKKKSKQLGLNTLNSRVIHNPVQVPSESSGVKDIDILFVGGLTPRKRPRLVLEALNKVDDELKCKIVGEGELSGALKKKHGHKVDFLGAVSHEKVLKLMSRSKVVCVPSVSESFGLVYVEAALSGAAVIGYENTIKEMAEVSGLSCNERKFFRGFSPNENDPNVLAGILEEVLKNYDNKYRGISTSLINKLSGEFSKESYINKIRALYEH